MPAGYQSLETENQQPSRAAHSIASQGSVQTRARAAFQDLFHRWELHGMIIWLCGRRNDFLGSSSKYSLTSSVVEPCSGNCLLKRAILKLPTDCVTGAEEWRAYAKYRGLGSSSTLLVSCRRRQKCHDPQDESTSRRCTISPPNHEC